jgi:two-component sensor histidine kinase
MRILVADDDPDFRTLAGRSMRREFPDAEITEVADAASLRQALQAGPVHLLVSDFDLRWADGFQILEWVRASNPRSPALMFTGTGNEELAVRAIKAGFDDYLVKSTGQLRRLATAARAAVTRIEARQALEENRDLLTGELYHRLHNNLQMVVGLIGFTARTIKDEDAKHKLKELAGRIQSLTLLQEKLYRGGDFRRVDFAAFLRQLLSDLQGLDGRNIHVAFDLDEAKLPVDIAAPMALIANEWVTNALKHAFPAASQDAQLRLAVRRAPGEWALEIADNGVGLKRGDVDFHDPKGLGTKLVRRLAQQLGGTLEVGAAENGGTLCRVTVRREDDPV